MTLVLLENWSLKHLAELSGDVFRSDVNEIDFRFSQDLVLVGMISSNEVFDEKSVDEFVFAAFTRKLIDAVQKLSLHKRHKRQKITE